MEDKRGKNIELFDKLYEGIKSRGIVQMTHFVDQGTYVGTKRKTYLKQGETKPSQFILWHGDPINGDYSIENARRCGAIVGTLVEDDEKPTLDGLTLGEKKCLVAFYSALGEQGKSYTFYKKDDMWQAYQDLNGSKDLEHCDTSLFNVCAIIVRRTCSSEFEDVFIKEMKINRSEEELDENIEGLKKELKSKELKIGTKKDIQ